ncbi:hypothetical protein BDB13_6200 [Rhodococcus sp. OK302]|jgi:hypothetical protein|nr:hypothetical protein BDB13_6200 [Rhodococcus sp. OK302]
MVQPVVAQPNGKVIVMDYFYWLPYEVALWLSGLLKLLPCEVFGNCP